jgi:hypothetical protein
MAIGTTPALRFGLLHLVAVARERFARIGPSLPELLLAHAVGVVCVSHVHYLIRPPSRQMWFVWEMLIAAVAWWPVRTYVRHLLRPAFLSLTARDRRTFVATAITAGLAATAWWAGSLADDLWVHAPRVATVLKVCLTAGQVAVAALVFAGLLAVTIRVRGRQPQNATDDEPRPFGWRSLAVHLAPFLILANGFAAWYVSQERTIYFWDYMVYWTKADGLSRLIRHGSWLELWQAVRDGTLHDDYGPMPAIPPAAVMAVFGGGRIVYILAVVNTYVLAVAALTWMFVRRYARAPGAGLLSLLLMALSTVAWVPLLRGYLDIGGSALVVAALFVYLARPAGRLTWTDLVLLGALLAAATLFRRWYGYFGFAFLLTAGMETAVGSVRRNDWREAAVKACTAPLIGFWVLVWIALFAFPWVRRAVTTDYADAYVAYQNLAPVMDRAAVTIDNCGVAATVVSFVSLMVLLCYSDTRRVGLFIATITPIMLFHMLKTADPNPHHCYLFLPAYVLLPGLAMTRILRHAPAGVRWTAFLGLAVWGTITFAIMFLPAARPLYAPLRPAVSRVYFPPMTRDDLPAMIDLFRATEAASAGGKRVAVVASSRTLNPTLFVAADRSLGEPVFPADRVVLFPEVDRVGGFPAGLFAADVVVVAWPPQTHLRPEEQQGVVLTARLLHDRVGIGAAFEPLPGEHRLGDTVVVTIYVRSRPIREAELIDYETKLRAAHPDRPAFYTPPPEVRNRLDRP